MCEKHEKLRLIFWFKTGALGSLLPPNTHTHTHTHTHTLTQGLLLVKRKFKAWSVDRRELIQCGTPSLGFCLTSLIPFLLFLEVCYLDPSGILFFATEDGSRASSSSWTMQLVSCLISFLSMHSAFSLLSLYLLFSPQWDTKKKNVSFLFGPGYRLTWFFTVPVIRENFGENVKAWAGRMLPCAIKCGFTRFFF